MRRPPSFLTSIISRNWLVLANASYINFVPIADKGDFMSKKQPLFSYLCRKVENEFPDIPNRAIPDIIAWSLECKNYASLVAKKVDLDNPDVVQSLLKKSNSSDTNCDYRLLRKLVSENKNQAIVSLNIEDLILCLNTMLIFYHPEEIICSGCEKKLITTVDDFEYVTKANDENYVYAVLCSDCLARELAKPRSKKTIYVIDGRYRHI